MTDSVVVRIYEISSPHTDKVYIGGTRLPLKQRFAVHRSGFKKWKTTQSGRYVRSFDILEFNDAKIAILEMFIFEGQEYSDQRERYYIESRKGRAVNKNIPGRKYAEYIRDNIEKIRAKAYQRFTCACGRTYTRMHKSRHYQSQIHVWLVANTNNNNNKSEAPNKSEATPINDATLPTVVLHSHTSVV